MMFVAYRVCRSIKERGMSVMSSWSWRARRGKIPCVDEESGEGVCSGLMSGLQLRVEGLHGNRV